MCKVYISVDIEGVTGVVHWNETEHGKADYDFFRKIMAKETNAAVEAAFNSGATEVIVRDAHGSGLNILPDQLHKEAKLIRNWADSPLCMMEGIDETYDAVIFVGYHAKSQTPDATLKHTMSFKIADLEINGVSMPEAGLNGIIAGMFDVPVIFLSGDKAICDFMNQTWTPLETVAVKEGIGDACITLHPEKSYELISAGVTRAMKNRDRFKPFKPDPPYNFTITYRNESSAQKARWYPGTRRLSPVKIEYKSDNLMDCLKYFYFCQG